MNTRAVIRFCLYAVIGFVVTQLCLSTIWALGRLTILLGLNAGAICGVYSLLDETFPWYKRLATTFLVFVGVTYFWPGIEGTLTGEQYLGSSISGYLAVPPDALFHFLSNCVRNFWCTDEDLRFNPANPFAYVYNVRALSILELGLSLVAIAAAFSLLKGRKWASYAWTCLASLSIFITVVNLVADELSVRAAGPAAHISSIAFISIGWSTAYTVAALLARGQKG